MKTKIKPLAIIIFLFFSFNSFAKVICFKNNKYKRVSVEIYVGNEYVGSTSIAPGKENCLEFGDNEYNIKYKVVGKYGGPQTVYGQTVQIY